jgi:hypothetical protein
MACRPMLCRHLLGFDVSKPFSVSNSSSMFSGISTSKSSTLNGIGLPSLPLRVTWIARSAQNVRFLISTSRGFGTVSGAHLFAERCRPNSIANDIVVWVRIQLAPGLGKFRVCAQISVRAWTSWTVWLQESW